MNKIDELKDKIVRNLRDQIAILKKIIKNNEEQIAIQKKSIEAGKRFIEKFIRRESKNEIFKS